MRSTSKVNGRSLPELVFCAQVIAAELVAVGYLIGAAPFGWLWVVFAPLAAMTAEQVTRPATQFVNYAAVDSAGVLHYIGKSKAFNLRSQQHLRDATGGRNGAVAHGKDWAAVLVEGGDLTAFEHYRTELQSLRVERRITYTVATAVLAINWAGVRTGLLRPRIFGNKDNTHLGRGSGGLRPWEWACIPALALIYAARPLINPAFPQWTRWTRSRR